jgi:hypothetical protein
MALIGEVAARGAPVNTEARESQRSQRVGIRARSRPRNRIRTWRHALSAAKALSKRANAQRKFVTTGDDRELRKLRKTKVLDAEGREVPFLTDEDELARQGDLGMLSFESIYARRG